jgi:hypothetical protein
VVTIVSEKRIASISALKMEAMKAIRLSETLIAYTTIWHCNPEDHCRQVRSGKFKKEVGNSSKKWEIQDTVLLR